MTALDPLSYFFAPFSPPRASLGQALDTLAEGARALVSGLSAVQDELARFALERLERHLAVSAAFLAGPWPPGAIAQITDYVLETAEAFDAEQTRLAGILAEALTESLLEEAADDAAAQSLPYSPWLERHDGAH